MRARLRGVTLIEVLFSMALLALVIAPMMTVFTASARTGGLAELSERMDASAAARIEELYGGPYDDALDARAREDDGLLTYVTLSPAGLLKDVDGRTACFHVIARADGYVRVVTPEGLCAGGEGGEAEITLNGGAYTAGVSGKTAGGDMPGALPPLVAVFAQDGTRLRLTLKGFPDTACVVYAGDAARVDVSGASPLLLPARGEALAYITATAHDPAEALPDAAIEAVAPLRLW